MSQTHQSRTKPAIRVALDISAFEPDAQARAILRGLEACKARDVAAAPGRL